MIFGCGRQQFRYNMSAYKFSRVVVDEVGRAENQKASPWEQSISIRSVQDLSRWECEEDQDWLVTICAAMR